MFIKYSDISDTLKRDIGCENLTKPNIQKYYSTKQNLTPKCIREKSNSMVANGWQIVHSAYSAELLNP